MGQGEGVEHGGGEMQVIGPLRHVLDEVDHDVGRGAAQVGFGPVTVVGENYG